MGLKLKKINFTVMKVIFFLENSCEYFIGYFYKDYKIKPLHITLFETSTYVKSYNGQTNLVIIHH